MADPGDRLLDGLDTDVEVLATPRHGWQDFVVRLAHGVRRAVAARPDALSALVDTGAGAPHLRPFLDSPLWVERFLQGLAGEGFSDDQAVAAYRGFNNFLWGHLWAQLGDPVFGDHGHADFEDGLEQLVERLEQMHCSSARRLPARAR